MVASSGPPPKAARRASSSPQSASCFISASSASLSFCLVFVLSPIGLPHMHPNSLHKLPPKCVLRLSYQQA